jgi:hypothetical protein
MTTETTEKAPKGRIRKPPMVRAGLAQDWGPQTDATPVPRKKTKTSRRAPQAAAPGAQDAPTAPPAKDAPAAPKKPRRATKAPTMAQLAEGYLEHLAAVGKSRATVSSYGTDIDVAVAHFGAETPVTDLTPEAVAAYFGSDVVTKTRKGRGKAEPTILKTRRVLRLALVWAAAAGLIPEAPVPAKARKVSTSSEVA